MADAVLPEELKSFIRVRVWSGFYSFEEILNDVLEGVEDGWFSEDELSLTEEDVQPLIRQEFSAKSDASRHWPAQTECDQLTKAFAKLTNANIISLENAGYTQSDGWSDFHELAAKSAPGAVRGGCFYHGQDLERAVAGQGVYLTFGAVSGADADSTAVGKEIVAVLNEFGLKPTWDQTPNQRIFVPLDWKRR